MIYKLQHTFKPVVLVPMLAIYPNAAWVMDDKKKLVMTSDNVMAKVIKEEKIHFLSKEVHDIVTWVYKTDVLSFGRKWHQSMDICTMEFMCLTLEKYEGEYRKDIEEDL